MLPMPADNSGVRYVQAETLLAVELVQARVLIRVEALDDLTLQVVQGRLARRLPLLAEILEVAANSRYADEPTPMHRGRQEVLPALKWPWPPLGPIATVVTPAGVSEPLPWAVSGRTSAAAAGASAFSDPSAGVLGVEVLASGEARGGALRTPSAAAGAAVFVPSTVGGSRPPTSGGTVPGPALGRALAPVRGALVAGSCVGRMSARDHVRVYLALRAGPSEAPAAARLRLWPLPSPLPSPPAVPISCIVSRDPVLGGYTRSHSSPGLSDDDDEPYRQCLCHKATQGRCVGACMPDYDYCVHCMEWAHMPVCDCGQECCHTRGQREGEQGRGCQRERSRSRRHATTAD